MTTSNRSQRPREHRRAQAAPSRKPDISTRPVNAQPSPRPSLPTTPTEDAVKVRPQFIVMPEPATPQPDTTFGGRIRQHKDDEAPSVQLPCKRIAFVYQRLSTTEQKKNSRYSLERQDDLERMAQENGYPQELVYVERRDLGISGTKGQAQRAGLAHLIQLIEQDRVESVYVVEISRISRDQTLITGLQFGELCREHNVIIVTPSMRLNLRDEMHMRMYRYEIDRAAEELKSIRSRMHGAKTMKARHGYHVGNSIPPGYVIDRDEKLPDGSLNPNHQKYKIHEPHAEVVRTIFRKLAEPGAYLRGVALECQRNGIAFSRLPDDLLAVKSNAASFARTEPDRNGCYPVTVGRLESIVSNPAYIGWFIWAGEVISKNNHPAIIDEETFWAVQKKRGKRGFRHEESYDPLPLAGLLFCSHHAKPRQLVYGNSRDRERAQYHCRDEDEELPCMHISAYILEDPICELIVHQCSFPGYVEEVLQCLTQQHDQAKNQVAANKREFQRITEEIENLTANLSRTRNEQQVDLILRLIDEKNKEKERIASVDNQPLGRVLSPAEVEMVREFLTNLKTGWADMTDALKNSFLHLVLERIDIRHDKATVEATVKWRTGVKQVIRIERPFVDTRRDWSNEEEAILRAHYATMPKEELCALVPGRTWGSIRKHCNPLGLTRPVEARHRYSSPGPYTEQEDQLIRDFQAFRITRQELLERLAHRTEDSIWLRMVKMGFRRRKRFVKWTLANGGEGRKGAERGDSRTREVVTNESCCPAAGASLRVNASRTLAIRRETTRRDARVRFRPGAASVRRPRDRRAKSYDAAREKDDGESRVHRRGACRSPSRCGSLRAPRPASTEGESRGASVPRASCPRPVVRVLQNYTMRELMVLLADQSSTIHDSS